MIIQSPAFKGTFIIRNWDKANKDQRKAFKDVKTTLLSLPGEPVKIKVTENGSGTAISSEITCPNEYDSHIKNLLNGIVELDKSKGWIRKKRKVEYEKAD